MDIEEYESDDSTHAARSQTIRKDFSVFQWRKNNFRKPTADFCEAAVEPPSASIVETPLLYFHRFITDDIIKNIVQNTNLYSVQKPTCCLAVTKKKIEQVMGMFFHMGLVKINGVRQYWEHGTRYSPVCDVMSCNGFRTILTMLHFVDNLSVSSKEKKINFGSCSPF